MTRQQRATLALVGGALVVAIARRAGIDLREVVEASGLTIEEAMLLIVTGLSAWGSRPPADQQDVVTPRPE